MFEHSSAGGLAEAARPEVLKMKRFCCFSGRILKIQRRTTFFSLNEIDILFIKGSFAFFPEKATPGFSPI
jgi:hypothetical protein